MKRISISNIPDHVAHALNRLCQKRGVGVKALIIRLIIEETNRNIEENRKTRRELGQEVKNLANALHKASGAANKTGIMQDVRFLLQRIDVTLCATNERISQLMPESERPDDDPDEGTDEEEPF